MNPSESSLPWFRGIIVRCTPVNTTRILSHRKLLALHNAWSPIIAALFTGNAIVLKCSEHVIWSTLWFVGAIKECLRACKFNPELIQVSCNVEAVRTTTHARLSQVVCCLPSEAEVLTKSEVIKHITFIGSEEVGRKVALAAAHNMTPLTLELGGKDPAIILPGTDLDRYISIWMRGILCVFRCLALICFTK